VESNLFRAAFSGALFTAGDNRFDFKAINSAGTPECNIVDHNVFLSGTNVNALQLFSIQSRGQDVSASTVVRLSLDQVDPSLAQDIRRLYAELDAWKAKLVANAEKTAAWT
jgi:hypothetical protein